MIKRYFTLCIVVLATGAAHAQKIAVSKGLKLELVSNMKMTMSMEMMGQNIENNTETSNTTQIELKEVNPSSYLFSNTITKMLMHTSAMGQEMNFDSDKKEDLDGPMGAGMKNVLNIPQEIVRQAGQDSRKERRYGFRRPERYDEYGWHDKGSALSCPGYLTRPPGKSGR